jgi:hypothetical protein
MKRLSQISTSFRHFLNDSSPTNCWFYVLCIFCHYYKNTRLWTGMKLGGVIRNICNTRSVFLDDFTHRKLTVCYVNYRPIYRPNFRGSILQKTALPSNMKLLGFPETSVTNLRYVKIQKNADPYRQRRKPESTPTYNTF